MKTSQLSFRAAKDSDVPFLLELRRDSMDEHLLRAGIPISRDEHLKRIKYQFDSAKIILLGGKEAGLLKTIEKEDYIEIIQFQVLKNYRGQGLGKQVLSSLLQQASERHVFIRLSVLKGNRAKNLYEKLGFQVVGETEDSLIMNTR